MFDDSLDGQPSQSVTNDPQAQATSAAANPTASPSTPAASQLLGASNQQSQPSQAEQQSMVSNAGPVVPRGTQDPNLVKIVDAGQHPLVHSAGILHSVARALAGNPSRVVIDQDGTRRVEAVPVS